MHNKRILTILMGCLLVMGGVAPSRAGLAEQVASANAALAAGRPIDALDSYKTILSSPALTVSSSAELWYNRGLAEEKIGNAPAASLSFRRALLLDPGFAPARRQLGVVLGVLGIPFVSGWAETLPAMIHPDHLVLAGSVLGWIGILALIVLLVKGCRRKWLVLAALLLILVGHGGAVIGTLVDPRLSATKVAVVTTKEAQELKSTPADSAASTGSALPGSMVRILSHNGAWCYVSVGAGLTGWIPSEAAIPLLPSIKGS